MYESFGDDPFLTEALVNRDAISEDLGYQAKLVHEFAYEKLLDVTRQALDLFNAMDLSDELRRHIYLSINTPWFDPIKADEFGNMKELQGAVAALLEATKSFIK